MSDGINDTIGQTSGSVGQFDHWLVNWYTVMPIPGSIFFGWSKTQNRQHRNMLGIKFDMYPDNE